MALKPRPGHAIRALTRCMPARLPSQPPDPSLTHTVIMQNASLPVAPGTCRIRQAHQAAALERLQRGIPEHLKASGYLQNPEEFASTRYLARALELLGTECESDGSDLVFRALANDERDLSQSFLYLIDDWVEREGAGVKLQSAHPEDGEDEEDEEQRYRFDSFMSRIKRERLSEDELDALIKSEGTVDFRDSDGCTPLLTACESYRWALENLFYAAQEDDSEEEEDDEESSEEDRARELAEAHDELAMHAFNLHAVLRRRPNMAVRAKDGSDALSFAAASGNADFVDLLLSHGAQVNADTFGAAVNSLAIGAVRKLAEHHADLAGPNLLLFACNSSSDKPHKLEMVQYLVEHLHCNVNARAGRPLWSLQGRVRRQGTPLMAAALTDDLAVVGYLLSAGAEVNAVDVYGNTALHYCSGQTWIAGDADAMWFAGEENLQVIKMLRQHGADDCVQNIAGMTPADLFASSRSHDMSDDGAD